MLVTKPSIAGFGMNFQNCSRMAFLGLNDSYEQYYQAVRRSWRFGQRHPVTVDIITTEGGANVFRNLERKAVQADRMFESLTTHMRDALTVNRSETPGQEVKVPSWLS